MGAPPLGRFAAISAAVLAEGHRNEYYHKRMFQHKDFWFDLRHVLPLHYKLFIGEVGCS